jgi:hypothetical protein
MVTEINFLGTSTLTTNCTKLYPAFSSGPKYLKVEMVMIVVSSMCMWTQYEPYRHMPGSHRTVHIPHLGSNVSVSPCLNRDCL